MIKIRDAKTGDAARIMEFQKAMAWETEKMNLSEETLKPGVERVFAEISRGKYYVAEENGVVIASLLITYEWSDWRNRDVWWFQSVYVIPEYRRKGVFSMMYNYIAAEALKADAGGLRLYVETNNHGARKTYESLGMDSSHYTMYEWLR